MRRLADFAPALRAMGGGLTISGGEPLVQVGFTGGMFAAAKRMGLHTALDTSGFLGARADDEYLKNVDLVLLDIKSGDPETYRSVTGVELAPTLRFAERLQRDGQAGLGALRAGAGSDRCIPTTSSKVARFVAPMKNVEWVEVLPFHQMGAFKWKSLGPRLPAGRHAVADTLSRSGRAWRSSAAPAAGRVDADAWSEEWGNEQWHSSANSSARSRSCRCFLPIGLGYAVGQISILGFSLGIGAVLFVGLFIGAIAPKAQIAGPDRPDRPGHVPLRHRHPVRPAVLRGAVGAGAHLQLARLGRRRRRPAGCAGARHGLRASSSAIRSACSRAR